jgi:hypothetical protein
MNLEANMTPRLRCGGVPCWRDSAILACAILLIASTPAWSQGNRPRNPPPDGPWNERPGGDPTDSTKQAEARRRMAQEYYDAGLKLLEKKQIQAAKTKFKAAIELVGKEGVGLAALGQLTHIHAEGLKQLEEVGELYKQAKYKEALQLAKKTKAIYAAIFDGIDGIESKPNISQLAAAMIKTIKADPKAQAETQEVEASKRFAKIARLEEDARKDETKYYDVFKKLKDIVKRYPDCPTGQKCAEQLQKLKADKKRYAIIQKEEQRRFIATALQKAAEYEKAGETGLAAAEYKKLKDKFPGKSLDEISRLAQK